MWFWKRKTGDSEGAGSAPSAPTTSEHALRSLEEEAKHNGRMIEQEPHVATHKQALGSTLYDLGEAQLRAEQAAEAADTLQRAREAYESLREYRWSEAELTPWIADVRARRARALAICDRAASALVEAQGAVIAAYSVLDAGPPSQSGLAMARLLAWNAWVAATVGDPDLAVASADSAIRYYLRYSAEINGTLAQQKLHVPIFVMAAQLAERIHETFGRADLSRSAANLAQSAAGLLTPPVRLPSKDDVRTAVTLQEALLSEGTASLSQKLISPATECSVRVPFERVADFKTARASAIELAEVSLDVLGRSPQVALRMALEAHAMLAGASEAGTRAGMACFGEYGPTWVALLHRAGEASLALGRVSLAHDFSDWLTATTRQLLPWSPVLSTADRTRVADSLAWQQRLKATAGDEAGADSAHDAMTAFAG